MLPCQLTRQRKTLQQPTEHSAFAFPQQHHRFTSTVSICLWHCGHLVGFLPSYFSRRCPLHWCLQKGHTQLMWSACQRFQNICLRKICSPVKGLVKYLTLSCVILSLSLQCPDDMRGFFFKAICFYAYISPVDICPFCDICRKQDISKLDISRIAKFYICKQQNKEIQIHLHSNVPPQYPSRVRGF